MDEEAKRFLDANDNSERVLNKLASFEQDFQNAKAFLAGDALVGSRRWLDLEVTPDACFS